MATKAANTDNKPIQVVLPDKKFTAMVPYVPKEKVKVRLFKDGYRYKEPLYLAINGRSFLIQRGVDVEVDDYVAAQIAQLEGENAQIDKRAEEEEREYQEKTAALGA